LKILLKAASIAQHHRFYLIDNGCHYKCVIPAKDLTESGQLTDESLELEGGGSLSINEQQPPSMSVQVDDLSMQGRGGNNNNNNNNIAAANVVTPATPGDTTVIDNIQKRQNYIFNKDLMNVLTGAASAAQIDTLTTQLTPLPSININPPEQQQQQQQQQRVNNRTSTTKEEYHQKPKSVKQQHQKTENLPSFSESISGPGYQAVEQHAPYHTGSIKRGAATSQQHSSANHRRFTDDHQIETLDVFSIKEARDRIIVQEIDRMFTSIRDHQSACIKARGEWCSNLESSSSAATFTQPQLSLSRKAKYATWGYSSAKRHVKAKVMELPYAEDLGSLAKRVGIVSETLAEDEEDDTAVEKVFVRIDDFISQTVSHVLQRSYSADYLNLGSGPRTRIKYVKIPSNISKSAQQQHNQLSYYDYADMFMPSSSAMMPHSKSAAAVVAEPVVAAARGGGGEAAGTDCRVAPYDLRYWSILKLLEEERQTNDGQFITYFDDLYQNTGEWKNPDALIKQVLGKLHMKQNSS
jgi:hypothetical protein